MSDHYRAGPIECWEYIASCADSWGAYAYEIGNAVKYLTRCTLKGSMVPDLIKARTYIDRVIELEARRVEADIPPGPPPTPAPIVYKYNWSTDDMVPRVAYMPPPRDTIPEPEPRLEPDHGDFWE